jgi:DNA-binding MarR family transcriptional regulator
VTTVDGPSAGAPAPVTLSDAVTRLRRSLRRAIRPEFPWESIPMAQIEILQLLDERPGITIGEVASTQRLAANTVSTLVGQLLRDGLIERRADATDRRIGRVSLSEAGQNRLEAWRYAHEQLLDDAIQSLPAVQQAELLNAVDAISALASALVGLPEPEVDEIDLAPPEQRRAAHQAGLGAHLRHERPLRGIAPPRSAVSVTG